MNTEPYLIGELAQKAGVTVRTIRYYISEGLLPSPQVRGRYSVYDEDYLKRIRLIQRMKDAYLPIKEIRRKLDSESEEEIEEFLNHFTNTPRSGQAALNYLAGVDHEQAFNFQENMAASFSKQDSVLFRVVRDVEEPPATEESSGTGWQRFIITNGLELHINDELFKRYGAAIPGWLEEFRKWLKRSEKS
jgi:DNA-binding transcriptional MerR regulator